MKVEQPSPQAPRRALDTLTKGDVFETCAPNGTKTGQFFMLVNDRRQARTINSVVLSAELITGELRQFSASTVVFVYPFAELKLATLAAAMMTPREVPPIEPV